MGKGLPRSRSRGDPLRQPIMKVAYVLDELNAVITDGAPGFGTAVLGDLPEGNVLVLGVVANLRFTKGDADIIDAFNGDFAIGTAPTADGTLAGAEVDLVASTAMVLGVSGVSSANRGALAVDAIFDNTDGSLELNLNLLIDDASISADSAITTTGVVHVLMAVLGDD